MRYPSVKRYSHNACKVCIKFCIYKYNISITNLNSQPVNLENGRSIVLEAWQGHRKGTKGPSPAENPDQYHVYLMAGICDLTKMFGIWRGSETIETVWYMPNTKKLPFRIHYSRLIDRVHQKQRITKSWAIQIADSIEKNQKTHVRTHHL